MSLRERLAWLTRMALLVFILASAAFLSAITAMRLAIHGREVEMPNLVGKTLEDAQATLGARGLGIKVADRLYSELPANRVARQSPPAGTPVKVGQRAHVVLSLGPHQVTIPALVGKSERTTRIELLRGGLQVGEISSCYLPNSATGAVIEQDPAPGNSAISPKVNLLISLGPREPAYVTPYLVGLSQPEAQRQLAAAGWRMTKFNFVSAPEWPHGTVMGQTPPPGARATPTTGIELQIAE